MAKKHTKAASEEATNSGSDSSIAWKIATAVLAIALLVSISTSGFREFNSNTGSANTNTNTGTGIGDNTYADDDAFLGNANAPVVIIEWSEYNCPFCKRFHEETFPSIKKDYIDTGKVKFVYRDFIIHGDAAQQVVEGAECAGEQGKYWEMHEKIFALSSPNIAAVKQIAQDLGLDMTKFNTCVDTRAMKAEVEKDQADGQKVGVSGTPGFLVNGKLIVGAQPFDVFKQAIDEALAGGAPVAPSQPSDPAAADTSNDPEIQFTVLTDSTCSLCDTSSVVQVTQTQLFPSVKVKEVDYNTPEGKALVQQYNINALPAYIFDSNVEKAANFAQVSPAFIKVGDSYVIDPAQTGAPKLLVLPDTQGDPVIGNPDAPITIIEFSDFQCPFCAKFFVESYPQLVQNYVNTGKVKIVFKQFPLVSIHPQAEKAAEAAECAGEQGKFEEMHDKLFQNQQSLSVDNEKKWAAEMGLDTAKFNTCLDSGKMAAGIQKDLMDGQGAGVSGTPAFFVGSYKISGAMPYEVFDSMLKELEAAEQI